MICHRAPDDENVMVAGIHPIRAKKARYFRDRRFTARIVDAPTLTPGKIRPDDWTGRAVAADAADIARIMRSAEDVANGGLRREPELPEHVDIAAEPKDASPAEEFAIVEDDPDEVARASALRRRMQGLARQASLDPDDGIER